MQKNIVNINKPKKMDVLCGVLLYFTPKEKEKKQTKEKIFKVIHRKSNLGDASCLGLNRTYGKQILLQSSSSSFFKCRMYKYILQKNTSFYNFT